MGPPGRRPDFSPTRGPRRKGPLRVRPAARQRRVKPWQLLEGRRAVAGRVSSVARLLRARRGGVGPDPAPGGGAGEGDGPPGAGVRVDPEAHRAWACDRELDLTPKEFDLLALLVAEAGKTLRRERIMSEVWDEHWWG